MKKTTLFLFAILTPLFFINILYAQENYSPKKGTIGVDGAIGYSSSFLGGSYYILDNLSLSAEILFSFSNPEGNDKKNNSQANLYNREYGIRLSSKYYLPLDLNFNYFFGPALSYTYSKNESYYDYDNFYRYVSKTLSLSLNGGLQYILTGTLEFLLKAL